MICPKHQIWDVNQDVGCPHGQVQLFLFLQTNVSTPDKTRRAFHNEYHTRVMMHIQIIATEALFCARHLFAAVFA